MEMIEGASTYDDPDEKMTLSQKQHVARCLADWTHQLSQLRFPSIGSLYFANDLDTNDSARRPDGGGGPVWLNPEDTSGSVVSGPVDTQLFCTDWRPEYPVNRGPYASISQLTDAAIHIHRLEIAVPRQRTRSELAESFDTAIIQQPRDNRARF